MHGGLVRGEVRWHGSDREPGDTGLSWYLVEPGERCSVHVHTGKVETWFFAAGQADVLWGDQRIPVAAGDAVRTPPGVPHGIEARGDEPVRFLNIVEYLDGVDVTTRELEE